MFAVHNYSCLEKEVLKLWGPKSFWRKKTVKALDNYGGVDWTAYFSDRPFWITETNCNWSYPPKVPNKTQACEMITGQTKTAGIGSIETYLALDSVFRVAWWNVDSNKSEKKKSGNGIGKVANARLMDPDTHELTPIGKAFQANFDAAKVECKG